MLAPLADNAKVVVEVGVQLKSRDAVITRLIDTQYLVILFKCAQQSTAFLSVETHHRLFKVDIDGTEGGDALLAERDGGNGIVRQEVSECGTALDGKLAEIVVELAFLELGLGLEFHADNLGLAVGVGGEIKHLRAGLALGEVVLLVTRHAADGKTLHHGGAARAVHVTHIIYMPVVAALEDLHMKDVLAHKLLVCHLGNNELAVFVEDNQLVKV